MNTPSAPFEKARSTNAGSTLPVHMTRTILISVVYCSLETPARSAAPYPHQKHKKPKILGLNSNPVPILISPLSQKIKVTFNWQGNDARIVIRQRFSSKEVDVTLKHQTKRVS